MARLCCFVLAVFVVGGTVYSQQRVRYDDHAVVLVQITTHDELDVLRSISTHLWGERDGIGPVAYVLSPEALATIDAMGLQYDILIEDIQPFIDAERARIEAHRRQVAGGDVWFQEYKTYDEVYAYMDELIALRPDLASSVTIGTSYEGRTISGMRISGPGTDKPAILFNGCQHAREWIAVMTPMFIADALLREYDTNPQIHTVVDSFEFLIVPIVNPDGYVYSWDAVRLWRKNRRDNEGSNCSGVDLNRNWEIDWNGGESTSENPCNDLYVGAGPFSEPESSAMRDFILARPQIIAHIDFHSYGQLILEPWSYTPAPPPDFAIYHELGEFMSDAIFSVHGQMYANGGGGSVIYLASGVFSDWTFAQNLFGYTVELRPQGGIPGFELPAVEIIPTGEEALAGVLAMSEWLLQGVQFSFGAGLPEIIEPDLATSVTFDAVPVSSGPLNTNSARLLWRLTGGESFNEQPAEWMGENTYQTELPGAPCGASIEYYFSIDSLAGQSYVSPQDAPAELYTSEALQSEVMFADDFENDLGWTVVNSPGLTDGAWDRGVPVGGGDRGDPPTDGDGSGSCYLTDNVDGNSDVDDGSTILTSPMLDASHPESYITYYRWYSNNNGAAPNEDSMPIEISEDDGTSWIELELVTENAGAWVEKSFRIADFVEPTNQFRIRFNARDEGAGSVVEAGVDGVQIVVFDCDNVPGDINGDSVVDIEDLLELLSAWGDCPAPPDACPADLDGSGIVDIQDLLSLLANWS